MKPAIGRLIQALLFDVSAFDPATITAVALAIGIAAFGACYIPARRPAGCLALRVSGE
jgi:hypothetical protein